MLILSASAATVSNTYIWQGDHNVVLSCHIF